ncbi:MAG: AAA family ATPase [Bacillota bacterium]|jgi:stage V sporulation protein K
MTRPFGRPVPFGRHRPGGALVDDVMGRLERGETTPGEAFRAFRLTTSEADARGQSLEPAGDQKLHETFEELDALVGLTSVKRLVRELHAFIVIQRQRRLEGLATEPLVLHMIFKGNPGTGKTTVARILGRVLRASGVLQKGHLVECERADLVGEYIGHTAQKTREQIRRALGGILFVDEGYSLARGGDKDFGKEAIDTLVKAMEDHKDELVVILAGYRNEMQQFIESNPGLKSRFPIQIDFPDFSLEELMEIADRMLKQRQYTLTPEARQAVRTRLLCHRRLPYGDENAGNARLVRNLIERAIRRQALRLVSRPSVSRSDLLTIEACDVADDSETGPDPT